MKIMFKISTVIIFVATSIALFPVPATAADCTAGLCGKFMNSKSSPKGYYFLISKNAPGSYQRTLYPGQSSTRHYKDADFIYLPKRKGKTCWFNQQNVLFKKYDAGIWWKFKNYPGHRVFQIHCK